MRYIIFIVLFLTACGKEDICINKYEYAIIKGIQHTNDFKTILLLQKGNDPELITCEISNHYIGEKLIEGPLYGRKL